MNKPWYAFRILLSVRYCKQPFDHLAGGSNGTALAHLCLDNIFISI